MSICPGFISCSCCQQAYKFKTQLTTQTDLTTLLKAKLARLQQSSADTYYRAQTSMLLIAQRENCFGPNTWQERQLDDILDKLEMGEDPDE